MFLTFCLMLWFTLWKLLLWCFWCCNLLGWTNFVKIWDPCLFYLKLLWLVVCWFVWSYVVEMATWKWIVVLLLWWCLFVSTWRRTCFFFLWYFFFCFSTISKKLNTLKLIKRFLRGILLWREYHVVKLCCNFYMKIDFYYKLF